MLLLAIPPPAIPPTQTSTMVPFLSVSETEPVESQLEIFYESLPLENDAPIRRRPEIKLAKEILNWHPTISINDGLSKTIDWFRKYYFE